jgi:hypothetical protein
MLSFIPFWRATLTLVLECYDNPAIHVVNFFEKYSTHYFGSLGQDPIVGFQKNKIKFNLCNLH